MKEKSVKRQMVEIVAFACFVPIALFLLCLVAWYAISYWAYSGNVGRVASMSYDLNVDELPGETPDSVTLFLPFPREGDDLLPGLYNDTKKNVETLNGQAGVVNTQYGKMLKVRIEGDSIMKKIEYSTHDESPEIITESVGFDIRSGYESKAKPFGKSHIYVDYPIVPAFKVAGAKSVFNSDTEKVIKKEIPVFVDFTGASGFMLSLTYDASAYSNVYVPMMMGSKGRTWFVSETFTNRELDKLHSNSHEKIQIEITKKGWIILPIWEIYDPSEGAP